MALSASQIDLLARCAVQGFRVKEIATHLGRSEATVRKYLAGEYDENFDRIYRAYREKALQSVVDHNFTLRDHLPRAYAVIGEQLSLDARDKKLQWEVAKWLLENPTLTGHQPHQSVNVNVGIQNNVAGEQVAVAFGDIGKQFSELLNAVKGQRSNGERDPHEKVGDEALPASYKLLDSAEGPGAKPNGSGHAVESPPQGTPAVEPSE